MEHHYGFPRDVWSKLVLLNEEEAELDWDLQKRAGGFKLSVFWKPNTGIDATTQSYAAVVKTPPLTPRNYQEETSSPRRKHKSPSVLKRDQKRLEKWRARWQPAQPLNHTPEVQPEVTNTTTTTSDEEMLFVPVATKVTSSSTPAPPPATVPMQRSHPQRDRQLPLKLRDGTYHMYTMQAPAKPAVVSKKNVRTCEVVPQKKKEKVTLLERILLKALQTM